MLHVLLTRNKNLRTVVDHTLGRIYVGRRFGGGPAFFDRKNVKDVDELICRASRVIHLPRPQV